MVKVVWSATDAVAQVVTFGAATTQVLVRRIASENPSNKRVAGASRGE